VGIQLGHVADLLKEHGYRLEVTEPTRKHSAEVGYNPESGARPLKRAIQREIQDPMARQILAGFFAEGDTILTDYNGSEITISRQK
jgi:ATP-dependent Clp protease ATP-binding subunit ClpB